MDKNIIIDTLSSVEKELNLKLGKEYVVTSSVVPRNNTVRYSITIRKAEETTAPSLPIPEEVLEDWEVDDIVNHLLEDYKELDPTPAVDVDKIMSYEDIKDSIYYRVYGINGNEALLENAIYDTYLDLAKVYFIEVMPGATTKVTKQLLNVWNKSKEEVSMVADHNMQRVGYEVIDLADIYARQVKRMLMADGCPSEELAEEIIKCQLASVPNNLMYVIRSRNEAAGAAVIFDKNALKDIRERWNSDFAILPSSISEIIAVPYSPGFPIEEVVNMVKGVNTTELDATEALTNSVYLYHNEKLTLLRTSYIVEGVM